MKGSLKFLGGVCVMLLAVSAFCADYESVRTFEAGEVIATSGLRVKLSGVTVVKAGAGEDDIGVVMAPCVAHTLVGVKMARTGTSTMIANGLIAAGTAVYPAALGKVATAATGLRIGTTLTATLADGDAVEVIRVPFTQAAAGDVTVPAGNSVTFAGGAGSFTASAATGTFATTTGAVSLAGTTTVAANKNLLCATGTSALDFSLGTGITSTTTGANTLNGTTTLVTGKTMAITDADALTVAAIKVPTSKTISVYIPTLATKVIYDVFIADRAYTVTCIKEVNDIVQGVALTLTPVKAVGTSAPAAATTPLTTAAIDGNGVAAYTVQTPALTATGADLDLAAGDRIGVVLSTAATTGSYHLDITLKAK